MFNTRDLGVSENGDLCYRETDDKELVDLGVSKLAVSSKNRPSQEPVFPDLARSFRLGGGMVRQRRTERCTTWGTTRQIYMEIMKIKVGRILLNNESVTTRVRR